MCQVQGDTGRPLVDPPAVLHLQRCDRSLARLDQHLHFLPLGGGGFPLRNTMVQQSNDRLQAPQARHFPALRAGRRLCTLHVPHTHAWHFQRLCNGHVWDIKEADEAMLHRLIALPLVLRCIRRQDLHHGLVIHVAVQHVAVG